MNCQRPSSKLESFELALELDDLVFGVRDAARARELGEQIEDADDREHLSGDLATLP